MTDHFLLECRGFVTRRGAADPFQTRLSQAGDWKDWWDLLFYFVIDTVNTVNRLRLDKGVNTTCLLESGALGL